MTWVVAVGLLVSLAALGVAVTRPRERPVRAIPWWIAVVLLGIDTALHAVIGVAAALASWREGGWLVIAALAIGGMLGAAILRPRLGGLALMSTAVLMPAVLIAVDAVIRDDAQVLVPLPVMLLAYSTRALVVGLLLLASSIGASTPAVPVPAGRAR